MKGPLCETKIIFCFQIQHNNIIKLMSKTKQKTDYFIVLTNEVT